MSVANSSEMKFFLLVFVVFKLYSTTESLNLGDISKSAADVAKGVIEKIPDAIPGPEVNQITKSTNIVLSEEIFFPF